MGRFDKGRNVVDDLPDLAVDVRGLLVLVVSRFGWRSAEMQALLGRWFPRLNASTRRRRGCLQEEGRCLSDR